MKLNYKLFSWVLVVLFVVLGFFYVQQLFKVRELNKYKRDNIESVKKVKIKLIADNKKKIDSLVRENNQKDLIINNSKLIIDSLLILDKKIIYIYKEKRKEIEDFNADELEKYWKNEFKN